MTLDKDLIQGIINSLEVPSHFGIDEDGEDIDGVFDSTEYAIRDTLPSKTYNIFSGVSKMVIVPLFCDFVFKVSFNGYYYYPYNPNRMEDVGEDIEEFEYFGGSGGSDSSDYCLAEYEKYQELKEAGISQLFAETQYAGNTKDGVRIFVQEKAYPLSRQSKSKKPISQASRDKAKAIKDKATYEVFDYIYNQEWWAAVIECYGEEMIQKLENYIQHDDSVVEDMHNDNYGWRLDGTPCIIDFTDYNG